MRNGLEGFRGCGIVPRWGSPRRTRLTDPARGTVPAYSAESTALAGVDGSKTNVE